MSDGAIAATSLERVIETVVEKHDLKTEKLKVKANASADTVEAAVSADSFISSDMTGQLKALYQKLDKDVWIGCFADESKFGLEMSNFIDEFAQTSPHIKVMKQPLDADHSQPCLMFCDADKEPLGLVYHAVPGGHEFTSFALAVYNAAGPKQPLDESLLESHSKNDR